MSKAPSEDNKIKIPLMWRLRAWWHGYDLEDVRARLSKSDDEPMAKSPEDNRGNNPKDSGHPDNLPQPDDGTSDTDDGAFDIDDDIEFIESDHIAVKAVWDTDRAHVAQVFWGDGFCGPGGPENIIAMTAPLNINSKRSAMVIGAGLGGPVRAMQKEYDTPVDGYESSKELATAGMEMSEVAGVAQDAPVSHIDFENTPRFPRSYDRAYAKESLFIITDKSNLVQSIFDHLKKDGLFLLTEYILSENADQSSILFDQWRTLEPYQPRPVSSDEMESCLENAGFSITVNEDITDFYLDLIVAARIHAKKVIKTMEADDVKDPTILKYMHNEAIFWDTRAKLLRSGDLKVIKYLGLKSS